MLQGAGVSGCEHFGVWRNKSSHSSLFYLESNQNQSRQQGRVLKKNWARTELLLLHNGVSSFISLANHNRWRSDLQLLLSVRSWCCRRSKCTLNFDSLIRIYSIEAELGWFFSDSMLSHQPSPIRFWGTMILFSSRALSLWYTIFIILRHNHT